MKRTAVYGLLLTLGAPLPFAVAAEEQQTPDIEQKVYVCERGATIPVTYINTNDGDSIAVAVIEGRHIPMTLAPSGSGARYVAIDEQQSYRWHSKGDEGILSFMEADHEAEEQTLLGECRATEASSQVEE